MRAKGSFFCLASCILFSVGKAADFTKRLSSHHPFHKAVRFHVENQWPWLSSLDQFASQG
jgi:hypothetical protein